jgi:hypothetical protein
MKVSALPTKEQLIFPARHSTVPTVDAVVVEERAASFGKRSIKTSAELAGLKLAVSMCDRTTLEGKDMPGKVAYLRSSPSRRNTTCRRAPPCAFIRTW